MYRLLTFICASVLIFGVAQADLYAQSNSDAEEYNEVEQYEKERTIQIVEEKDTENQLHVESGMLASSLPSVEAISDNGVAADNNTIKKLDENQINSPEKKEEHKKMENMSDFGKIVPDEFFESSNSGSGNSAGAQCSTVGVSY